MIDLAVREQEILSGLKDFQQATVNRVEELFQDGFRRVLVADEVGLGKTLVAKGVIAKRAHFYQKSLNKEFLKVIYVCSNQSIAGQNLRKLKVHERVTIEGVSDTRLSMQHLKIYEQMHDPDIRKGFVQLIPLTPGTSFNMTHGCGNVLERSLMFAVLRRSHFFQPYISELEKLMISYAESSFSRCKDGFEERVSAVNKKSGGKYLDHILKELNWRLEQAPDFLKEAERIFDRIKEVGYSKAYGANKVILRLRKMMAEISVEMMDADLVIMDEFQRFPELIKRDEDNETAMLAHRFFSPPKDKKQHPHILLLSATPYKLYSTLEEIRETQKDEHYEEFMQVVKFLFDQHEELSGKFRENWKNYSMTLNTAPYNNTAVIIAEKNKAEDCLYKGICRTERIKVPGASALIDKQSAEENLKIQEDDILAFVDMNRALSEVGMSGAASVEYIKSAPFIMSFMQHYKLKHKLLEKMKENQEKLPLLNSHRLWVNRYKVAHYQDLNVEHARYNKLKEIALPSGAEKLLWIPPAQPYYPLGGPFKGQEGFSQTLVFSAWEMVPRAIAALLSYEAERLTVGELIRKTPKTETESRSYFARRRFPAPRIRFSLKDNEPENMNHLCLLYPSAALASLYNPIDGMNRKLNLRSIKKEISEKIREHLEMMKPRIKREDQRQDERWYYMAPLLMDQKCPEMQDWFQNPVLRNLTEGMDGEDKHDDDKGIISRHLQQLKKLYENPELLDLGRMPHDLEDVLAHMAIASPAVCALRILKPDTPGAVDLAFQLAKTIVDRFNTPEAIAILDLSYERAADGVYWKNILRYCRDGNLQAVLDEYAHMLIDGYDYSYWELSKLNDVLIKDMIQTFKTHTASYVVDTYQHFTDEIRYPEKRGNRERYMRMRASYAVGFYDTRGEKKSIQRKENLRLGFNSPFRPFVLATTSIGQEGLDFHYYCRNIVHWNLPSNPVDLEQREGRIDRYKCHAIRLNIAHKYGKHCFKSDLWQEMFKYAREKERSRETSDLVPFWCVPERENETPPYKIQRIVPMYPMSRDRVRYDRLNKILSLYRLSIGQAKQEELITHLFETEIDKEEVKQLYMNLSPYFRREAYNKSEDTDNMNG